QFITPDNVQNGVAFWNQYEDALNRAWQVYGVPPEIIVGIIGVIKPAVSDPVSVSGDHIDANFAASKVKAGESITLTVSTKACNG
ncbi:lytic murein transglycosylase, partial [Salmonella enterica subsp. enterica serovar Montevideo]|nr:lytic murein transglycosylase [Salmonella enterica subsp. enterica serovar Montevideo]